MGKTGREFHEINRDYDYEEFTKKIETKQKRKCSNQNYNTIKLHQ